MSQIWLFESQIKFTAVAWKCSQLSKQSLFISFVYLTKWFQSVIRSLFSSLSCFLSFSFLSVVFFCCFGLRCVMLGSRWFWIALIVWPNEFCPDIKCMAGVPGAWLGVGAVAGKFGFYYVESSFGLENDEIWGILCGRRCVFVFSLNRPNYALILFSLRLFCTLCKVVYNFCSSFSFLNFYPTSWKRISNICVYAWWRAWSTEITKRVVLTVY